MYRYAYSLGETFTVDPQWRRATEKAKLRRIELDCIADIPLSQRMEEIRCIREMTAAGTLEVASIHPPWGWKYYSTDETERRKGVRELMDFLEIYRELGVRNYTIHGSSEPNRDEDRPAVMAALRRSIEDMLPMLEKHGASANIELLPRTCIGRVPEELEKAIAGFPEDRCGICFDVNHLSGHPEKLPEYVQRLAPHIRTFHISDYDGIDECHWYPGLGVIDWAVLMDSIRTIPQDVTLIFESNGFLHTPSWQDRGLDPAITIKDAENNAFFLENAREIMRRQKEFTLE